MRLVKVFSVLFLVFLFVVPPGNSGVAYASEYFDIVKVADGVYAAVAKPGVLCNAAIIITDDGVIVVDTHLRPSWAKDLIQEIKKLTNKPVRYVINTHWHNDHTQGNKAYEGAYPAGTEFISHHNTREDIINKAIPSIKQTLTDMPGRIAQMKTQLESGKRQDGTALPDSLKDQLRRQLANNEAYLEELKSLQITIPNVTFDRSLALYSGDRQVQVLYFGEGHTRGDVVVYLPKEKVLVTGDLLIGGLPFMRDAVPLAWASTLEGVGKLDFETVIGGHGDVMKGKDRLNLVLRYLNDLVPAVKAQMDKGASVEDATKAVTDQLAPKYEKDFPNFKQGLAGPNGNVAKTYEALKAKK